MSDSDSTVTITIRKRPWWFWTLAELWALLEVLIVQTAVASVQESEYRAAAISWTAFAALAVIGTLAWLFQGRSRA